jgi:hypothetical protein
MKIRTFFCFHGLGPAACSDLELNVAAAAAALYTWLAKASFDFTAIC